MGYLCCCPFILNQIVVEISSDSWYVDYSLHINQKDNQTKHEATVVKNESQLKNLHYVDITAQCLQQGWSKAVKRLHVYTH